MDWHGLLDETPRAGCGLPPHELLVEEESGISETTRAIALDLGCPPELNAKTPLLKTKHTLWWGRKLRLQQTWNSPPCRLVWWHQWSPPALDSECSEMYLPGKMWLRCNSGLKVVGVGNHFLIRFAACPQEGIQDWYYKPGQKSKAREIRGARAEPITAVPLNGNVLKPCRPVLVLAFAGKRFRSESPWCTACQRPENKDYWVLSSTWDINSTNQGSRTFEREGRKNVRVKGREES